MSGYYYLFELIIKQHPIIISLQNNLLLLSIFILFHILHELLLGSKFLFALTYFFTLSTFLFLTLNLYWNSLVQFDSWEEFFSQPKEDNPKPYHLAFSTTKVLVHCKRDLGLFLSPKDLNFNLELNQIHIFQNSFIYFLIFEYPEHFLMLEILRLQS